MCAIAQNSPYREQKMALVFESLQSRLELAPQPSTIEKGLTMNTKMIGTCLIAGALILPTAGYAADSDTGRTFVKDSVITTKVKAELAAAKPSTLVKVSVDTDNAGVVVLTGTAKTQADKDRAESITRNIKGVTTVENNIQVKTN